MKAKKIKEVVAEYPKIYETFQKPSDYNFSHYKNSKPSSFNGMIEVKRYRITIEEIDEPIEVIHERLEQLWLECDNWHHWTPLENAAKKYNYTFKGERGSLAKQRQ